MGDDNFVVEYIDVAPIAEEVSCDRLYYILFVHCTLVTSRRFLMYVQQACFSCTFWRLIEF